MKPLTFIGVVAILSSCCGCDDKEARSDAEDVARPVKMMTVGDVSDIAFREYPAKVKAHHRVKLAFQVTGQIIRFPVKAGDTVKAGQIIAELDQRDFINTLKSAISRYNESKTDFERHAKLVKKAAVAVSVFEAKRMAYEVAEADMKIAAKALADTRLKAPFDGVVAGTYVDNYQNIKAQEAILSLQDIASVELVINVPEKDVARAPAGKTLAELNATGAFTAVLPTLNGKAFPLKIKEREMEADADTQTFRVVMIMEAPKDVNIMPGMTAVVRVSENLVGIPKRGHWIPVGAVAEDSADKRYVWVIDGSMNARKRTVETDGVRGDSIRVLSGLSLGEKVAIAGVSRLAEGMAVKELTGIDGRELVSRAK